jgi:hypothetical protein
LPPGGGVGALPPQRGRGRIGYGPMRAGPRRFDA